MKDFFGTELNVGDDVAYMEIGYRSLQVGKIASFTKTGVQIIPSRLHYNEEKVFQRYIQIIKKPNNEDKQ